MLVKDLIRILQRVDLNLPVCTYNDMGIRELESVWLSQGAHKRSGKPKMVWTEAFGYYVGLDNPGDFAGLESIAVNGTELDLTDPDDQDE